MADKKKQAEPILRVRGDLKQRDVRNLELEAVRVPNDRLVSPESFSFREVMLKAAIGAGWIEEPACSTSEHMDGKKRVVEYYFDGVLVDELHPQVCYRAGGAIVDLMAEFKTLDPN